MKPPIVAVELIKSPGANFNDRNQIRELAIQGYTAAEISDIVRVEEKCVASFVKAYIEKGIVPSPEPESESEPEPEKKVSKKKVSKKVK